MTVFPGRAYEGSSQEDRAANQEGQLTNSCYARPAKAEVLTLRLGALQGWKMSPARENSATKGYGVSGNTREYLTTNIILVDILRYG